MKSSRWRTVLIQLLKEEFSERKSLNPTFSMRRWANDIGVSAGALSAIINGKRLVTPEMATKIVTIAIQNETRKNRLFVVMGEPLDLPRKKLTTTQARLLCECTNQAILSACTLSHPLTKIQISKKLNLPLAKIEDRIDSLINNGLLTEQNGAFIKADEYVDILNAHDDRVILENQPTPELPSLTHASSSAREDVLSMSYTFFASPEHAKLIRQEIQRILDAIDLTSKNIDQGELLQFSAQLLPVNLK